MLAENVKWDKTVDVVVLGYGMAGAIAAITARDAGSKVAIIEKQPQETLHSSSSMSGGIFVCPNDVKGAITHMEALYRINEDLCWTDPDILDVWAGWTAENKEWVEKMGGHLRLFKHGTEHPEAPRSDAIDVWHFRGMGFRMMLWLYEHVNHRGIEVIYNTLARDLLTNADGEVIGLRATGPGGKEVNIKASKAVILATGGFEFDERMKLQYLKVYPSWFNTTEANTGDGIKMAIKVGADLWHMNCVSAQFIAKFPDFPIPFSLDYGGAGWGRRQMSDPQALSHAGFIIVDRYGRRFTCENVKRHCTYYELTGFDTQRLEHPRVPSHYIFDRKRIEDGPIPMRTSGPNGPHKLYRWSADNGVELEKGWIISSETVGGLAGKLGMKPEVLESTVENWNRYCAEGKDPEFGRRTTDMVALDNPPFYAIILSPGGPNTQGGPRRNREMQIVNPDGDAIPGLYGAGECGSVYGMLYPQGGGNLAECIGLGRLAGENAAKEKAKP